MFLSTIFENKQQKLSEDYDLFVKSHLVAANTLDKYLVKTTDLEPQVLETEKEIAHLKSTLKGLQDNLKGQNSALRILEKSKKLSHVEQGMRDFSMNKVSDNISSLEKKISNIGYDLDSKSQHRSRLVDYINISKNYLEMDLSFLKLTKTHEFSKRTIRSSRYYDADCTAISVNLPLFASFNYFSSEKFEVKYDISVKNDGCKTIDFRSERCSGVKSGNHLHVLIRRIYDNIDNPSISGKIKCSDSSYSIIFSHEFLGFIPETTKKRIKEAKKMFGEDIYIVAEAKKYDVQVVKHDPLIIGIKHDKAFFIDAFDCTPLEEFVKNTYVEGKAGQN